MRKIAAERNYINLKKMAQESSSGVNFRGHPPMDDLDSWLEYNLIDPKKARVNLHTKKMMKELEESWRRFLKAKEIQKALGEDFYIPDSFKEDYIMPMIKWVRLSPDQPFDRQKFNNLK